MTKQIVIGSKTVELLANAATPYYYTQIFGEEFFEIISGETSDGKAAVVFQKLAYVMSCQAAGTIKKASKDDFLSWLEDFEPMDLTEAIGDIANVYYGTLKSNIAPK